MPVYENVPLQYEVSCNVHTVVQVHGLIMLIYCFLT